MPASTHGDSVFHGSTIGQQVTWHDAENLVLIPWCRHQWSRLLTRNRPQSQYLEPIFNDPSFQQKSHSELHERQLLARIHNMGLSIRQTSHHRAKSLALHATRVQRTRKESERHASPMPSHLNPGPKRNQQQTLHQWAKSLSHRTIRVGTDKKVVSELLARQVRRTIVKSACTASMDCSHIVRSLTTFTNALAFKCAKGPGPEALKLSPGVLSNRALC